MIRSLSLAAILTLSLSGMASAFQSDGLFARLEVRTGRVQVIQEGVETTFRKGEDESVRGATHLEVSAGSEVRISYPGVASVHIWGPASLDWKSVPTRPTSNLESLESYSSGGIEWNVFHANWCDLEVRRGRHLLNMPGDWSAVLEGGSVRLRGLSTGPLEVRVNAGDPLRLFWSGDVSQARPPLTVYPGSNLRLEKPVAAKIDRSGTAQAWQSPAWPYRRTSDAPARDLAQADRREGTRRTQSWPDPGPARQRLETQAQVQVSPQAEEVRVRVEPQTPSVAPVQPFAEVTPKATLEENPPFQFQSELQGTRVEAVPEPLFVDSPAPVNTVPLAVTYQNDQWRGVSLDKLIACGPVVVEECKGVETRVFAGGRHKILVDRFDGKATW
ncbi:MAG: hypothetical protein KDB61_04380, partial [Planctomycetes bacterium]|nr:hypothetical protein [Planctomycetota bacterium]